MQKPTWLHELDMSVSPLKSRFGFSPPATATMGHCSCARKNLTGTFEARIFGGSSRLGENIGVCTSAATCGKTICRDGLVIFEPRWDDQHL